jgi:predicted permease
VLALGVGVNLAEFQIFNALLFQRISVRDMDSLRGFSHHSKTVNSPGFPYAAVGFYREYNTVFSAVLAESSFGAVSLEDDPDDPRPNFVSGNYFTDLGATPAYGRLLDQQDAKVGAPPVVVLGYGYWQRHFASDPTVVTRVIRLNNKPVQIVGVAPYDFDGLSPRRTTLWLPITLHPYLIQGSRLLEDFAGSTTRMYGRLKPGVSPAAAEAQLRLLAAELQKQHPQQFQPGEWLQAEPLTIPINAKTMTAAAPWILLVLLVLLAACANLGNMLLARGLAREREIEIRIAVGAGRWRVIRQLMTENMLLAVLGSVAALVVGKVFAKLCMYFLQAPPDIRISVDWRILVVGGVFTVLSALAFGLAPAIQTVRRGPAATRSRQVLVAVQVAASCVLLIVASLLTRGLLRGLTVDVRFDYTHMLVVDPELYSHNFKPSVARQMLGDFASRLQQLPGVTGATVATIAPLGGRRWIGHLPGSPPLYLNAVAPSYFSVMRIPIVRGRTFVPGDQDAVIVSESAVHALWPNEEPVGKICDFDQRKRTVIGVAKDSGANNTMVNPDTVEAYTPLEDQRVASAMLIVHTNGDPAALVPAARSTTSTPGLASSAWLMQTRLDQQTDALWRIVKVIGTLGAVATLLAAIGIFGLVAFAVSQRTREIGVRMALGARSRDILHAVLLQYTTPVGVGVVAGAAIAWAFGEILHSQFYGFAPLDAVSYAGALTLFAVVGLAAALAPATRALRIDPASALRSE